MNEAKGDLYHMSHKMLRWGTVEKLNALIDDYFADCSNNKLLPTPAGLCLHLGIVKETWNYYINERWRRKRKSEEEIERQEELQEEQTEEGIYDEVGYIPELANTVKEEEEKEDDIWDVRIKLQVSAALKKARLRLEEWYSQLIISSKYPVGILFLMKNILLYSDNPAEIEAMKANNVDASNTLKVVINIDSPQIDEEEQSLKATDAKLLENGKD
jgi:hypothetical protein